MADGHYKMTSRRPYLFRALYDWINDNSMTPYIVVDTSLPDVLVPQEFVQDNRIVLNIGSTATQGLSIGDENILFSARFGGQSMEVIVPMTAVLGIYAKESGKGMLFTDVDEPRDPNDPNDPIDPNDDPAPKGPKPPHLTVVK